MRLFVNRPTHFDRSLSDSTTCHARPASLEAPDGSERPGVALMTDNGPRLVITPDAALRLAGEIADALDYLNTKTPTNNH